ncbi:BAR/IMD domain-containing adapter protein 2-like 2 [Sparus aurata]|uniref:BAR/IMD domain-containing adapter protein 2-like 2 n=1 Tax=Sparus aurata TaxID=8175 RepID=UPI0011C18D7F|nr:uncharacterized protein LOC115589052 [Sparus aurata]
MMRRMRSRSRTICLSLAFITVFLYLLLALVSLPIHHQPCDPPLPPRTHVLRDLARADHASVGPSGPTDPAHRDSSSKGANKDAKGRVRTLSDGLSSASQGKMNMPGGVRRHGTDRAESVASGLSKLEALFDHPLYNMPSPPIPEEDWLLKVKPKIKASEKSSQMWVSASKEGYEDVRWNSSSTSHPPWLRFHLGISRWQLYPRRDPNMDPLTEQLATQRIVSAVLSTEPDARLTEGGVRRSNESGQEDLSRLRGGDSTTEKGREQERDEETNYNLYYFSDFERHNAEIAAFHLDRILGYRRIPPAVGRLVDVVEEIKRVTTDRKVARTFFTSPVGNVCFYGQCSYYCSTEHAVCGRPRKLEASLAVMLPDLSLASRRSWRSPWRRSYSRSKLAKWESEPDYCSTVKKTPPYDKGTRLVDFIDLVVLDFLMSNMDRHHYETFEKFGNNTFLLHLDNGRAFGRHSKDEPSILAPLEQCCRIRRTTWLRLRLLSLPQFRLSDVMRASLSHDPLHSVAPLLSEPHLAALDRRLKTVLETNLMEHFNPGLQKLVALGNSYVKAFQALAVCSEAYFSAVAKMGDQALHTLSSRSLGDVLIQISETQRRLTAEMEGVFRWFQIEVLQAMEKNVKLDEEYIDGSRRVYELEVRNQAEALEKQLRRGAYRDSLENSEYMLYLRQSQQEILKEEERRYRFLAEKHCGLTQSLLFLINKTGASLQQKADGWKEKVNDTRGSRPRTPTHVDQDAQLRGSVSSLLQTVARDEDMSWARREQQALGRVPSRAPSPLPSRSRSSSVGESLGLGGGRAMRALVSHPSSSNPKLLPFNRGETVTVLVQEPRNGWLYGRTDSSLRQGWFPAAYVAPIEDFSNTLATSGGSLRSHSMNNLLDPTDTYTDQSENKSYGDVPPPATPNRRASVDFRPVSPLPEKKLEPVVESKPGQTKSYNEHLPPPPPPPPPPPSNQNLRRGSVDFRPISPLPERKGESASDVQALSPHGPPENPLFPRGTNPFATVKLRPTTTNDRSSPRIL